MFDFKEADLVPGPLDGVLYDGRERLESAEWDFLFWWVSLRSKENDIYIYI